MTGSENIGLSGPLAGSLPPSWNLYGEAQAFPDVLHIERIFDRAAGLDWVIAPHRHVHLHQFFLIQTGTIDFVADGLHMQPDPPFLLSVPAGTIHGFRFSVGTDGLVLTLPLPNFADVLGPAAPFGSAQGKVSVIPMDISLNSIFSDIYHEFLTQKIGRNAALRALASLLVCAAMRALPEDPTAAPIGGDPRFATFLDLLQQQVRNGWTVAEYARQIGVSERHLTRICHKATAQSAAKLIEITLMREACRLLVYTRMSVSTVGYQLGFDDPSYFSRAFKRAMGMTPAGYRAVFEKN